MVAVSDNAKASVAFKPRMCRPYILIGLAFLAVIRLPALPRFRRNGRQLGEVGLLEQRKPRDGDQACDDERSPAADRSLLLGGTFLIEHFLAGDHRAEQVFTGQHPIGGDPENMQASQHNDNVGEDLVNFANDPLRQAPQSAAGAGRPVLAPPRRGGRL